MCPAHPYEHFIQFIESCKEKQLYSSSKSVLACLDSFAPVYHKDKLYYKTVRSKGCQMLVSSRKCLSCAKVRPSIWLRYQRWKTRQGTTPSRYTNSSSHAKLRYINTPQVDVDKQVCNEFKVDEVAEWQKYVGLVFDEMKVKEGIVYNKNSGEIIGYVNLGEVTNQLLEFERKCASELSDDHYFLPIAKYISCFMVRGIFQHFSICSVCNNWHIFKWDLFSSMGSYQVFRINWIEGVVSHIRWCFIKS